MGALAHAQTGWQSVTFHFERATPAQRYTIYVDVAGNGSYREGDADAAKTIRLFDAMPKLSFALLGPVFRGNCETHAKNIAQTGKKTLMVENLGGTVAQCTFNYSDDEYVNEAVSALEAVAETMQVGEELAHEHRFDKLALDAEMTSFVAEVKAGRAIDVGNIADVLQSIVEDDRVMDRVKRNAARLLADSNDAAKATAEGKIE